MNSIRPFSPRVGLIIIGVIFTVTCIGLLALVRFSDNARQGETLISNMRSQVNRVSVLEWQSIATLSVNQDLLQKLADTRNEFSQTMNFLTNLHLKIDKKPQLITAWDTYNTWIDKELRLIEAGNMNQAKTVDEKYVDPAFENLYRILVNMELHLLNKGEHARKTSLLAALGLILGSGLLIGLLIVKNRRDIVALEVLSAEQKILKRSEEALREREEKYRNLFNNAEVGMFRTRLDGSEILDMNEKFLQIFGRTREEMQGNPSTIHWADPQVREEMVSRIKAELRVNNFECRLLNKQGEVRDCLTSLRAYPEQGILEGSIIDVSDRKRVEERVQSLARFPSENPNPVLRLGRDGTILYANSTSRLLLQYWACALGDRAPLFWQQEVSEALASQMNKKIDVACGDIIFSFFVAPIGEADYVNLYAHDITDRKLAEEKIKASLREKDILISEIHHRVKNNLQVISSLLNLQARASKNPEVIEGFRESKDRIRSMAMIHEKLYNSGDFARIDLAGYVRSLSEDLFQSHAIHQGKIDLTLEADKEVYVDIIKAIPCGLIMNELISNALKHAFPGDRPGKLQIIIGKTKSNEIDIVVRDNGLGLPDNVDIHRVRSVGLYLVNGLVKNQLDGQIEVGRDNGTEFRITFPL